MLYIIIHHHLRMRVCVWLCVCDTCVCVRVRDTFWYIHQHPATTESCPLINQTSSLIDVIQSLHYTLIDPCNVPSAPILLHFDYMIV